MRLTPTERDRLLLFSAAELARARRARGLRLNVPEATALIADTVCETARDGGRLAEAIEAARSVLGPDDVLPGVADVVTE
ncbi:urease subunit gamma, partial [Streptomyces anthocyanicus]